MRSIRTLLFFLLVTVLFYSCSITQRRYMPGYSVHWNQGIKEAKHLESAPDYTSILDTSTRYSSEEESPLLASASNTPMAQTSRFVSKLKQRIAFAECDVIVLKNGTEINAKVLEINPTEIKYKKCDNIDGPTIIINKSDATKIRYANGITELVNSAADTEESDYYSPGEKKSNPVVKNTPHTNNYHKTLNPFAIASLIAAISCIFIIPLAIIYTPFLLVLIPASLVLGIIAMKEINANPQLYKGKGMAMFGIIFGGIITSLVLFFLLLFLLVFAVI